MDHVQETRKRKLQESQGFPAPNLNKLVENHPEYDKEFSYTMNYVNYMFEPADLKKHTEKWLNRSFKNVPDYEFVGVGQIAWLLNNSAYVSPEIIERASQKINKFNIIEQNALKIVANESPHTAFRKRTDNLMALLEGFIDDSLLNKIIEKTPDQLVIDAGAVDIEKIKLHFSNIEKCIDEEFQDKAMNKEMKDIIGQITNAVSGIKKTSVKSKSASVRKKKTISPSKIVRKLQYLKNDPELVVASINPEKIVGAEVLWAFNVKTRKLTQFIAKNPSGLTVKGTTILNYDETKSFQKTLRKPKEILTKVLNSGKVNQRKLLEEINSVQGIPSGRINADTILVKVF